MQFFRPLVAIAATVMLAGCGSPSSDHATSSKSPSPATTTPHALQGEPCRPLEDDSDDLSPVAKKETLQYYPNDPSRLFFAVCTYDQPVPSAVVAESKVKGA